MRRWNFRGGEMGPSDEETARLRALARVVRQVRRLERTEPRTRAEAAHRRHRLGTLRRLVDEGPKDPYGEP